MYQFENGSYDGTNYNKPSQSLSAQVSGVMKQVYFKMFLGLIVSGIVSWWGAHSLTFLNFIVSHSWSMIVLIIVEFGLVIGINSNMNRMSAPVATLLFYLFAAVNGLTLFPIFYVYDIPALAKTFFICAGMFGVMSIYGYFTTKDLTKFGQYMIYALFGLIIVMIVNIFTASSTLDWIVSIAGVFIFLGLTAWDTQAIKQMCIQSPAEWHGKISTYGALSLYLDFINLFLFLLRLFGGNRD